MKNRQGSYKKLMFSEVHLGEHLESLSRSVEEITELKIPAVYKCTLYIILFLRIRHQKNWLQQKNKKLQFPNEPKLLDLIPSSFELNEWEKNKLKDLTLSDLLAHFNLKGIPEAVNRTLLNWHKGLWQIELLYFIPSPRRLLKLQVENKRCVTLITKRSELDKLVLEARDPLSFVLHDLHHADHFFGQEKTTIGQLGFYALVDQIYDQENLQSQLKTNAQFKSEFEYVVSDMNAYVIHLFKCFKSAFEKNETQLFENIISSWNISDEIKGASLRLNTPQFTMDDELSLISFFESQAKPSLPIGTLC